MAGIVTIGRATVAAWCDLLGAECASTEALLAEAERALAAAADAVADARRILASMNGG